jgi:hypothetical protein
MSTAATNIAGSAAGAIYAQTTGSEAERRVQDRAVHQRGLESSKQAENASGIGETDGKDNNPHERDADGRRIWEVPGQKAPKSSSEERSETQSRDATGERGQKLDLSG